MARRLRASAISASSPASGPEGDANVGQLMRALAISSRVRRHNGPRGLEISAELGAGRADVLRLHAVIARQQDLQQQSAPALVGMDCDDAVSTSLSHDGYTDESDRDLAYQYSSGESDDEAAASVRACLSSTRQKTVPMVSPCCTARCSPCSTHDLAAPAAAAAVDQLVATPAAATVTTDTASTAIAAEIKAATSPAPRTSRTRRGCAPAPETGNVRLQVASGGAAGVSQASVPASAAADNTADTVKFAKGPPVEIVHLFLMESSVDATPTPTAADVTAKRGRKRAAPAAGRGSPSKRSKLL